MLDIDDKLPLLLTATARNQPDDAMTIEKIQTKFKRLQCLESRALRRLVPREVTVRALHDLQTQASPI